MSSIITCKNCSKHYHGHYCPECGQSSHTERIDFQYFIHDIPHSIFHIDKGFFYTLKWMFKSPGRAIKEYLAGKRAKHFRPFAYVILLSTICTLLTPMIEKGTMALYMRKHPGTSMTFHQLFFEKYISLLIFILIPFLSLVTWLFFKKKAFNYWEHVLANTFLAAQLNVVLLALKLFGLVKVALGFDYGVNFTMFMVVFMFYYSLAFEAWMKPHKNGTILFFKLFLMNFLLVFIYLTAFSLTGIMTAWWNF